MLDFGLAATHHLLIFALAAVLVAELAVVRDGIDAATVRRVAAIDLWYGILAALILVVGFSRANFAGMGWTYYQHNIFFWAKIATFAVIGLVSLLPTMSYIRWRRGNVIPSSVQILTVRRYLWTQVVLFALLPIFAAAMARGFGER